MHTPDNHRALRVLIVGRSPNVLLDAVEILRRDGYRADATNQFDRVLNDYDVTEVDILVFGGMVPPDTKEYLREQVSERNPRVTFVQGLAGIAGVIAAQVVGVTTTEAADDIQITYDDTRRLVGLSLAESAHVTVEAWWATFVPPEPLSTSILVIDEQFAAGAHSVPLPAEVPSEASFVVVTLDSAVRVLTVGAIPQTVRRLVPGGGGAAGAAPGGGGLPPVRPVTTHGAD